VVPFIATDVVGETLAIGGGSQSVRTPGRTGKSVRGRYVEWVLPVGARFFLLLLRSKKSSREKKTTTGSGEDLP
jgi:hypothetical protein